MWSGIGLPGRHTELGTVYAKTALFIAPPIYPLASLYSSPLPFHWSALPICRVLQIIVKYSTSSYLLPYQLRSPDGSSPKDACLFSMGHRLTAEELWSFPLSPFSHAYYDCFSVVVVYLAVSPTSSFLLHLDLFLRIKGKKILKCFLQRF